jgi:hypothetical protein
MAAVTGIEHAHTHKVTAHQLLAQQHGRAERGWPGNGLSPDKSRSDNAGIASVAESSGGVAW